MAMAILNAAKSAGPALARSMPTLVDAAKQYAPSAMEKLKTLTGSKTPEVLAADIAKSGNAMQAQGLLFNAMRSGMTIEMIAGAVPLLDANDKIMLASHHMDHAVLARRIVDAQQTVIPEKVVVPAPDTEVVLAIERTCDLLSISSSEMADLIVDLHTVKTSDIKQYQAYFAPLGKRVK